MTAPVTAKRVATASEHIENADAAARACRDADLPYFVALALLEKESGGKNIYGHDVGGVNTVRGNITVTDRNFLSFLVKVMNGATSNGVGPLQITYAGELKNGHRDGGYFRQMAEQALRPWVPEENMLFGFRILKQLYDANGESWEKAGAHYNGGSKPNSTALTYGRDLAAKAQVWKKRLGIK